MGEGSIYFLLIMSHRISLLFTLLCSITVYAQETMQVNIGGRTYMVINPEKNSRPAIFDKDTILDKARIECIYYHLASDPEINESREEIDILLIGPKKTQYKNYDCYRRDSTFSYLNKEKATKGDIWKIFNHYPKSHSDYIIRDLSTGEMEVHESIVIDHYVYKEPRIDFEWELYDDTLTICGHLCHQATCFFRGREWTAWYADDITQSEGPWKFYGLPGLILQVEDSKREHIFTSISIRYANVGNNIIQLLRDDFKTTRTWLSKAQRNHIINPTATYQSSGIIPKNLDGSDAEFSQRKGFFNPIEKE